MHAYDKLSLWVRRQKPCLFLFISSIFSVYNMCFLKFSVQFSSATQSCLTLCNPMNHRSQASLSITNPQRLLKLMSIKSVMPSSRFILCHPLLLQPPIPPSIRVFSKESALHMRWPKYWSFSFSISPSNEDPGLISFRMDWLDLLAVQGTLKKTWNFNSIQIISEHLLCKKNGLCLRYNNK